MKCYAHLITLLFCCTLNFTAAQQNNKIIINVEDLHLDSQWKNKNVAFLGDSMTDKRRVGTSFIYWEYLTELLNIQPFVYGVSGNQWDSILKQAQKLYEEQDHTIDAIFIFAGTNDFNNNIPLGHFYDEEERLTNHNGQEELRKYRLPSTDSQTFCGRINKALAYLKNQFPKQQIIVLTPIHRGYANFNAQNIQPEESFANGEGLYIHDYVNALKEAVSNWSIPVIDLFSQSGLYPLSDAHTDYFYKKDTDRLHPNAEGHYRLAKTIMYKLLALPSTFK